jgi:translation initiation factor 1
MRPVVKSDGVIRVSRETKGRKGKCVSLVSGVSLNHESLLELAKRLKQKCGSGGTVKGGVIEIQGDHRDTIVKELSVIGFSAKKAGG